MDPVWSLTESDPGVFTGILSDLGVRGLEIEELWDLDMINSLAPVHALIFLFKWTGTTALQGKLEEPEVSHFFARQVITNACGSIAILNAALNVHDEHVQLGDELSNLKDFSLDPETIGHTLSSSEKLRTVHNSFARSDPYSLEENQPDDATEDAYHFITYLPIGEKLYELDGLKPLPVSHGVIPGGRAAWTELAKTVVQTRIASHPVGEVSFNLMALTSRTASLARQATSLQAQIDSFTSSNVQGPQVGHAKLQLRDVNEELARAEERRKEWDTDNVLRRQNHLGLIHQLLLTLAKEGKLRSAVEGAKEEMKIKLAAARSKKGTE